MSKISDFYSKVLSDDGLKKELESILSGKTISGASDEDLVLIGKLAERLGYDITLDEARNYISGDEAELDDSDLDAVAGGKGDSYETRIIVCQVGGKAETE